MTPGLDKLSWHTHTVLQEEDCRHPPSPCMVLDPEWSSTHGNPSSWNGGGRVIYWDFLSKGSLNICYGLLEGPLDICGRRLRCGKEELTNLCHLLLPGTGSAAGLPALLWTGGINLHKGISCSKAYASQSAHSVTQLLFVADAFLCCSLFA